ncbi:MAG: ArsR family transcriptional regulator [Treponema sp.]|jgi:predicted transcriptional regulator|nr:ArsR family transcriptional regulator [Treponema sp.]
MKHLRTLVINPRKDLDKLKALASAQRILLIDILRDKTLNINELSESLSLPQSSVATNIGILEDAGLVKTEKMNARKGNQKKCRTAFDDIIIKFPEEENADTNHIDVEMPIGIFTNCEVSPPCGLCSEESIIGYLDTPNAFLEPDRPKAGLLWMGSGFVEYKFPNNAMYESRPLEKLEVSVELSSETPGTNKNWPSDITMWINGIEIGVWTSPGDFGDRRGAFTPSWWKLEGSQYGLLKHWSVTGEGSFVDGVQISPITLKDLDIQNHHSIKVRLGVKETARHKGGMNIFGRGFGNYGQGIRLSLQFKRD